MDVLAPSLGLLEVWKELCGKKHGDCCELGAKVSERLESDVVGIEPVAHWEAQPKASSKKNAHISWEKEMSCGL